MSIFDSLLGGSSSGGNSSIGSAISPIAIGIGAGQLLSGIIKKRQATDVNPPMEDPRQASIMNDLLLKKKQLESGFDPTTSIAYDQIGRQQSQATQNILRASGGNVGSAMSGIAMTQRAAGDAGANVISQNQQQQGQFMALAESLADKMARRKLELQMYDKLQKLRESAEETKSGFSNLFGGLSKTIGVGVDNDNNFTETKISY